MIATRKVLQKVVKELFNIKKYKKIFLVKSCIC